MNQPSDPRKRNYLIVLGGLLLITIASITPSFMTIKTVSFSIGTATIDASEIHLIIFANDSRNGGTIILGLTIITLMIATFLLLTLQKANPQSKAPLWAAILFIICGGANFLYILFMLMSEPTRTEGTRVWMDGAWLFLLGTVMTITAGILMIRNKPTAIEAQNVAGYNSFRGNPQSLTPTMPQYQSQRPPRVSSEEPTQY